MTEDGVVGKVRVRVNANLKARSLRELEEAKKNMHISAFRFLLTELEKELKELAAGEKAQEKKKSDPSCASYFSVEELCNGIMIACSDILTKHESHEAADYLDDAVYRYLVAESLETKEMGKYKFLRWLHGTDSAGEINTYKDLKQCHREWNILQKRELSKLAGEERVQAALALCRSMGLVRIKIDEHNTFDETPLIRAAADGERRVAPSFQFKFAKLCL